VSQKGRITGATLHHETAQINFPDPNGIKPATRSYFDQAHTIGAALEADEHIDAAVHLAEVWLERLIKRWIQQRAEHFHFAKDPVTQEYILDRQHQDRYNEYMAAKNLHLVTCCIYLRIPALVAKSKLQASITNRQSVAHMWRLVLSFT
jgi:hypothetical protein